MTIYLSNKETKFLIKNIPTKKTLCSGAWSKFYQIRKKQYQSYLNLFRKLRRERLLNPIYKVNINPTLKSEKILHGKYRPIFPMSTDIKMHTKILISQYQQHIKGYYIFNM